MSRERRISRAEREAAARERAEAERVERERAAAARRRREARALWWRRVRLWQHSAGHGRQRRTRERIGGLLTVALLAVVAVYVATRSLADVLGTVLVLVVASPVLVMLFFDRRRP